MDLAANALATLSVDERYFKQLTVRRSDVSRSAVREEICSFRWVSMDGQEGNPPAQPQSPQGYAPCIGRSHSFAKTIHQA